MAEEAPRPIVCTRPRPGVLLVTLNRPARRNALGVDTVVAIAAELARARDDDGVGCVVLAGDERAFSAGADIKEMVERGFAAVDDERRRAAWAAIEDFPKPVVAAVQGYALGGGHELAMLADIVIAGENARFGQPEIDIGILPGDGATQRITRVAGKSLAMKMILTGEPIDAAAALRAGLVAEVVPHCELPGRALDVAEVIARKPPVALRMAKRAVLAAYETALSAGLRYERAALERAFHTEDRAEGMAAFVEKRPPRFKGA